MARRIKSKSLDSREQRLKLKPQGKPYWVPAERSVHVGYRRLKGRSGSWCSRIYLGDGNYEVEAIGVADDTSDADGVAVLSFWDAQRIARDRMVKRAHEAAGKSIGPYTVEVCVADYIAYLEARKKTAADARWKSNAFIVPALGSKEVAKLTTEQLEKWLDDLATAPARVRTEKGAAQRYRKDAGGEDAVRARRATANRIWVILRAALNRAFRNKRVPSDSAWRRVEPFRGTDSARERFLSVAECKRLANASAPDFRRLVQCALATGMRYGELAALRAADFDLASGTVLVRTSKANKFRRVVLNDEGVSLFQSLAAGKVRDALMLTRDDGEPWRKNYQEYPMKAACKAARIVPAVGFHQLRHAYASLAVAAGAPLAVVAENLGHRDARMCERFYRHFEKNYVADTIKATAPSFGFEIGSNVSAIR